MGTLTFEHDILVTVHELFHKKLTGDNHIAMRKCLKNEHFHKHNAKHIYPSRQILLIDL